MKPPARKTILGLILTVLPACVLLAEDQRVTPVVRAYRRAGPAVVNISSKKTVTARLGFFGDDLFAEIFPGRSRRRRVPVRSLGSGVVISPHGYIVTNAHVVQGAEEISVSFHDRTKYQASVVVADINSDLAIIRIDPPKDRPLPFLPLGRSDDLMAGETVIAVGNPLGFANTVTTGVISATDRTLSFRGGVKYSHLIQTDAPINQGNSGGPLLNIKGELIGINTAIRADAQNIGFAISVGKLRQMLPVMLDVERLNRVLFGATVRQRPPAAGGEVYVTAVRPASPAHGKLLPADRILAVDGVQVGGITHYVFAMLAVTGERTVRFRCRRGGEVLDVPVRIKHKPRPDGGTLARRLMGVKLRVITPQLAGDLRLPLKQGLLVVLVEKDSPAERLGIQLKDILFHVDGYRVKDIESLGLVLEGRGGGEVVRIGIRRGNTAAMVNIRFRKAATTPKR